MKKTKNKILSGLSLGIILQWLTLFFSTRRIPYEEGQFDHAVDPFSTGGFPFKVFEYPLPPFGGNIPEPEGWHVFFLLNFAIWLTVGVLTAALLGKRFNQRKTFRHLAFFAILLTAMGFIFLTLKFD